MALFPLQTHISCSEFNEKKIKNNNIDLQPVTNSLVKKNPRSSENQFTE